jgi:hypothetical protein
VPLGVAARAGPCGGAVVHERGRVGVHLFCRVETQCFKKVLKK